jgi:hypothetical protein
VFGISRKELKIFLERSLKNKHTQLLLNVYKLQGNTFSYVVRILSRENPESTIKYVLKKFKQLSLLDFGDFYSRGKPLRFTCLGEVFVEILGGDKE